MLDCRYIAILLSGRHFQNLIATKNRISGHYNNFTVTLGQTYLYACCGNVAY